MKTKIALCQMAVVKDKDQNIIKAAKLIEKAARHRADIICLPEIFNGLYANDSFVANAEERGGLTFNFLSAMAKKHSIYLIGGSISEKYQDKLFNTCFIFNRAGELIGSHRKVHLFDIEVQDKIRFKESDTFSAGNDLTVVATEYGKIGVAICFDIRFGEWFRLMANQGVRAVFVPAAFNMTTGPAHWELAFRSRAVDNQIFMLGCAPARNNQSSYVSYGNSLIVNPWGDIVARLNEKEGILIQEIDLKEVEKIRQQLPIIANIRADLYQVQYKKQ